MTSLASLMPKQWAAALFPAFDNDCLTHYHVAAPCNAKAAVADTVAALTQDVSDDFTLYALPGNAGFVGVEPALNHLTTFGLYPTSRTPYHVNLLWAAVRTLLNPSLPITVGLYARNTPARRFVRRAGFWPLYATTHPRTGRKALIYTLPPNSLCLLVD